MQAELQIARLKSSNEILQSEVSTLLVQKSRGLQDIPIDEIINSLPDLAPDVTTAFYLF